jgi:hypothetical protein
MKLPLHSPSLIDSYPLNSLPPFTLFQGRPLMAMAAGEPPPHATRASIRAPGPPSTSLHSTPEPTPLLDVSIAPKPSSPPPPIKASRRCRCPPPRSPLSFSRSPELHRVVKKLLPTSFISLPCRVRAAARRPPATCPAPPLAVLAAMDAGAASLTTRLGFPSPQLRVGPNPVPIHGP